MINFNKYQVHDASGPLKPRDFFVLKRGDVLAIAALRSYVNNILTMLDLEVAVRALFTPDQREYLQDLADSVAALADEWDEDFKIKLPD